jgi:hypothetical protein
MFRVGEARHRHWQDAFWQQYLSIWILCFGFVWFLFGLPDWPLSSTDSGCA